MTGKASHRLQLQSLTTCDVANTTSYKKSPRTEGFCSGLDGTRTRDPLRDRQIF